MMSSLPHWVRRASFVVYCLLATFASVCLIVLTLGVLNFAVYPRVTFSADSRVNEVIGFLLYLAPIILCIVAGFFIARTTRQYIPIAVRDFSAAALVLLTGVSATFVIILALAITIVGCVAWLFSMTIPEQIETEIPGYTVVFRQETDLEYTTLRLELHRADGFVAVETIDSDDETICQRLVITREDEQLRLICDRANQSTPFSLDTYINIEQKAIFLDGGWHKESRISFDQLYFYEP